LLIGTFPVNTDAAASLFITGVLLIVNIGALLIYFNELRLDLRVLLLELATNDPKRYKWLADWLLLDDTATMAQRNMANKITIQQLEIDIRALSSREPKVDRVLRDLIQRDPDDEIAIEMGKEHRMAAEWCRRRGQAAAASEVRVKEKWWPGGSWSGDSTPKCVQEGRPSLEDLLHCHPGRRPVGLASRHQGVPCHCSP
jgi:hypothetical protein